MYLVDFTSSFHRKFSCWLSFFFEGFVAFSSCSYVCICEVLVTCSDLKLACLAYVVPRLEFRVIGYLLIVQNPSLLLLTHNRQQAQHSAFEVVTCVNRCHWLGKDFIDWFHTRPVSHLARIKDNSSTLYLHNVLARNRISLITKT